MHLEIGHKSSFSRQERSAREGKTPEAGQWKKKEGVDYIARKGKGEEGGHRLPERDHAQEKGGSLIEKSSSSRRKPTETPRVALERRRSQKIDQNRPPWRRGRVVDPLLERKIGEGSRLTYKTGKKKGEGERARVYQSEGK